MKRALWSLALLPLAAACGAEFVSDKDAANEAICRASSRINGALLGDNDVPKFKEEARALADLVTDEEADPDLAGPGLAVTVSADKVDDGKEGFTRALESVQALNNACIAADL